MASKASKDPSGWMDYARAITSGTLQPGDKVKFVGDHPWRGEVGEYVETIDVPFGGEMDVFEVLGKGGIRAGAKRQQYTRI